MTATSFVVPEAVSSLIRERFVESGIGSKRAAAGLAGVSESRWRQIVDAKQYKNGEASPARTSCETLSKIAIVLELDPIEILMMSGISRNRATAVVAKLTKSTPPTSPPPSIELAKLPEHEVDLTGLSSQDLVKVSIFVAGLKAA